MGEERAEALDVQRRLLSSFSSSGPARESGETSPCPIKPKTKSLSSLSGHGQRARRMSVRVNRRLRRPESRPARRHLPSWSPPTTSISWATPAQRSQLRRLGPRFPDISQAVVPAAGRARERVALGASIPGSAACSSRWRTAPGEPRPSTASGARSARTWSCMSLVPEASFPSMAASACCRSTSSPCPPAGHLHPVDLPDVHLRGEPQRSGAANVW